MSIFYSFGDTSKSGTSAPKSAYIAALIAVNGVSFVIDHYVTCRQLNKSLQLP